MPNKKIKPTLDSRWGLVSTEVKDSPTHSVFVYPACLVRGHASRANGSASRSTPHPIKQPAIPSDWPNKLKLSEADNLTWHCAGIPSQIIRNTRRQTPITPISPPSSFRGADWALLWHDCHTTLDETIWRRHRVALALPLSLSLRPWAGIRDRVSNTCVCYLQIGFPPPRGPGA